MTNIHKAAREALIAWWEEHRPMGWTAEQHRAQPTVNAQSETDKPLMEIAAAALRAALDEAPGEEREAFEAWYQRALLDEPVHRDRKERQWSAWQARAMLAARPSALTVALTDAQAGRVWVAPDGSIRTDKRRRTFREWGWKDEDFKPYTLAQPTEGKEGGA